MTNFPTVWVDHSPDTLLDLSIQHCVKYPLTLFKYNKYKEHYELREGLFMPEELCQRILAFSLEELTGPNLNAFLQVFEDTSRTRLQRLHLSNSSLSDKAFQVLTQHKISSLDISGCENLTSNVFPHIEKLSNSLLFLNVGNSPHIFPLSNPEDKTDSTNSMDIFSTANKPINYHLSNHRMGLLNSFIKDAPTPSNESSEIKLPNLRHFTVHNILYYDTFGFQSICWNACHLTYLDLEGCNLSSEFGTILVRMSQLVTLKLCEVPVVKVLLPSIVQLKQLVVLDISRNPENVLHFENPNQDLQYLVDSLPKLMSLDISGTNLAGNRTQERQTQKNTNAFESPLTDIPGLVNRCNKPLDFLGLFGTTHDACYRHHIPAKKITGDANAEQILLAGQMYVAREKMIQKVLNDLFEILRLSNNSNSILALDVILEAMRIHLKVKHVQISGSASLFYIVKGELKEMFNIKMRRRIIKTLIDGMHSHITDVVMLRNGCLTLIHFKIPGDVFFDYERLASLLLLIVSQEDQNEFVQRIALYLLNSLACQVDGMEKKMVGDRGAITVMLQVIQKRLLALNCDEVMETAWSTMWNVTDETPVNCSRFLENKGMDLFLGCLEAFPDKPELLRNMMGLLGNVAEVKELRNWLMKDEYLLVISKLLQSRSDGIEVSYNAAGILSHIASDGAAIWDTFNIQAVTRREVLNMLVAAIEKWDLSTKRNINYRSFKPILRLVEVDHTPEARLWAVWALANLTTVYPEKYCHLVKQEGGVDLLKSILMSGQLAKTRISELVYVTITNCMRYESVKESIDNSSEEYYDVAIDPEFNSDSD